MKPFNLLAKRTKKKGTEDTQFLNQFLEDLTPQDNINYVDKDRIYSKTLKWALSNKKVTNIALTGPYGSGKSSIIKSFVKEQAEYKFLNISLATFKDYDGQNENVLEKSILQQMIYKVKSSSIPFSRFKRIKSYRYFSTIFNLIIFLFCIAVGLFIINPLYVEGKYNKTFIAKSIADGGWKSAIVIVTTLLFLFSLFWVWGKIYSFVRNNFHINKISLPKVEIEVGKESNDSVFHKYLDEILYFFEATKYNVVVFEDLDRFNNLEIFENLRELNTLINNSEQISRRVVFMYAVKDDIFGSEDDMFNSRNRTKFFDFIVPVIPVINSSNSREILMKKLKESTLGNSISEDFINDITIYIDDMRILINICNEFFTYKQKLGVIDLTANKLLAMIVYKNIYPADFAKLQFNNGMVYQVMTKKDELIKTNINDLEALITSIEKDLNAVENEALDTINELLVVYTDALGLREKNAYHSYDITVDNTKFNDKKLDVNFFDVLMKAKIIRYNLPRGNGQATVEDIVTVFGTKLSYFDRAKIIKIKEEQKSEALKRKLENLRKEKEAIPTLSLQTLINRSEINEIFTGEIREKKLLTFLLRNGFIDEMYSKYITHFYPGSLTTEDIKFLMAVKNQEPLPYNYKLTRIDEILKSLHEHEFRQAATLNYDLLNHILISGPFIHFDSIITQLIDGSEQSLLFIDSYKEVSVNKELFIKRLCGEWHDIWVHIHSKSKFSIEKKDLFLHDIIKYADVSDIIAMNRENLLKNEISTKDYFFDIVQDWNNKSRLESILVGLEVKFDKINPLTLNDDHRLIIYNNNLYNINKEMISFNLNNSAEEMLSFSSIIDSKYELLINYIQMNINEYVENVLLKINGNIEEERGIIDLLNNENVTFKNKIAIIQNFSTVILDITSVTDNTTWHEIVNYNKMSATWENIVAYIENESMDRFITKYLNNEENSFKLSNRKMNEVAGYDDSVLLNTSKQIITCTEIKEKCFEMISVNLHQWLEFDVSMLSKNRVKFMIDHNMLLLTTENFDEIKKNHRNLQILLIERNIKEFLNDQDSYQLDPSDYEQMFLSINISMQNKEQILKNLTPDLLQSHAKLADAAIDVVVKYSLEVSNEFVRAFFESNIEINKKLKLLVQNFDNLAADEIPKLLSTLSAPYSDIAGTGKRPLIDDTYTNRSLANKLKESGYISSWKEEAKRIRIMTKLK